MSDKVQVEMWTDDEVADAIRKSFCEQFSTVQYLPWDSLTDDQKERWLLMARSALEVLGL